MNEENLNIKKNELLRQFEHRVDGKLIKVEYSEQGKNIFLTRFEIDKSLESSNFKDLFIKSLLDKLSDEGHLVVPTCPIVASFFKGHRTDYRHLLPAGINL